MTYRPQALPKACFAKGSPLALVPEPNNPIDRHAVAVYDGSGKTQVGYVPAELAPTVAAVMREGVQLVGYVLREYREHNSRGKRLGIHIAIFPAGQLSLLIEDQPVHVLLGTPRQFGEWGRMDAAYPQLDNGQRGVRWATVMRMLRALEP